jgi:hypothetical protein
VLIKLVGTWTRLAHEEVAGSAGTLVLSSIPARGNLMVVCKMKHAANGSAGYFGLVFNDDGESEANGKYAGRRSHNGGNDQLTTSAEAVAINSAYSETNWSYSVTHMSNNDGRVKLCKSYFVGANTDGANLPRRVETAATWHGTDQVNKIQLTDHDGDKAVTFAVGSYVTVYGATDDISTDEKTTLTDVPINSRYEEVDTRKIYRRGAEGTFTSTDYTTSNFTAVGSTVAITSNSAVSTSTPSNTANRVYATIPSLKSTDAWSCNFQLYVTADATNDYHTIAFCTNSDAFNTSGQNHISLQTQGGSYNRFVLNARIGGSNSETATSSSTRSLSTNYYCTLSSDGAGTARIRIWTNSNRTGDPAQDKTLSIANIGTLTTVMHGARNSGDSNVWSGTVSNVSLTNPEKWIERGVA